MGNPSEILMASALVHAHEVIDAVAAGQKPEVVDLQAFKTCMDNPMVQERMAQLDMDGMLPVRRDGHRYHGEEQPACDHQWMDDVDADENEECNWYICTKCQTRKRGARKEQRNEPSR